MASAIFTVPNSDGTYDLWDGHVHLLERVTMRHCDHFVRHGHSVCDDNCPNR